MLNGAPYNDENKWISQTYCWTEKAIHHKIEYIQYDFSYIHFKIRHNWYLVLEVKIAFTVESGTEWCLCFQAMNFFSIWILIVYFPSWEKCLSSSTIIICMHFWHIYYTWKKSLICKNENIFAESLHMPL